MMCTRTTPPAPPHAFDTLDAEVSFVLLYLTRNGWRRSDALDAIQRCVTNRCDRMRERAA